MLSFGVGLFFAAAVHALLFELDTQELSVGWIGAAFKWIGPHRTYIYLAATFLGIAVLPFVIRELGRLAASWLGGTIASSCFDPLDRGADDYCFRLRQPSHCPNVN